MKTFTEPLTSVRIYESGAVRTLAHEVIVREQALADDTDEVRLPVDGPYRIVMHCQSSKCRRTGNTKNHNR